jgi:hypothetical protein
VAPGGDTGGGALGWAWWRMAGEGMGVGHGRETRIGAAQEGVSENSATSAGAALIPPQSKPPLRRPTTPIAPAAFRDSTLSPLTHGPQFPLARRAEQLEDLDQVLLRRVLPLERQVTQQQLSQDGSNRPGIGRGKSSKQG